MVIIRGEREGGEEEAVTSVEAETFWPRLGRHEYAQQEARP